MDIFPCSHNPFLTEYIVREGFFHSFFPKKQKNFLYWILDKLKGSFNVNSLFRKGNEKDETLL